MINVELSNIWSCVSLPQLLGAEKDLYDAHLHLCNHQPIGNDYLGWLALPDAITAKTIHAVRSSADEIRAAGNTLVVIGAGSVVTHDIPANVVAAGNPCRVLRPITEEDRLRYQTPEYPAYCG